MIVSCMCKGTGHDSNCWTLNPARTGGGLPPLAPFTDSDLLGELVRRGVLQTTKRTVMGQDEDGTPNGWDYLEQRWASHWLPVTETDRVRSE